jgi:hypothetical protein
MNQDYLRRIRGGLARVLAAVLMLALLQLLHTTMAHAIPPGGASPDTPGTYAEVYPKELAPGATISFAVSGYPAGEILNIKIDDGAGYSDTTTAGSGVVHTQAIGANGSTSGSLRLPGDISEGWHWLRFLASEQVEGKGVLGYTNGAGSASNSSHPTAFYVSGPSQGGKDAKDSVVPGTSPGNTTTTTTTTTNNGSASGGTGGAGDAGGSGDAGTAATGEGEGDATAMSADDAAAAADAALLTKNSTSALSATGTGTKTTAATTPGAAPGTGVASELPWPGIITLGVALLVGIVILLITALRRPEPVYASGIDHFDSVGDGHSFGGGIGSSMEPSATDADILDSFTDNFVPPNASRA